MLNNVLQNSLNASELSGFSVCIWGGEGLDVTLPSSGSGVSCSGSGGGSGGGYLESTRLCD